MMTLCHKHIWILILLFAAVDVLGCSFLASTHLKAGTDISHANEFMQRRGPDGTRCVQMHNLTACHNLLHMTGKLTPQPFVDESQQLLAVYNGEIYNYRSLASKHGLEVGSDGEIILPLFARHGELFVRMLEGEFAIVVFDFSNGRVVLASDIFSTKPLWYSRKDGFTVASYRSGVERTGAPGKSVHMLDPNTIAVYDLHSGALAQRRTVHEFDLRQHKHDVSDFLVAFKQAVARRTDAQHPVFIGLSSGYDSGAIQVALKSLGKPHASYTVFSTEDIGTIKARTAWTGDTVEANLIVMSEADRHLEETFLHEHCEHYLFSGVGRLGSLVDDPATHGLSLILRDVRKRGLLVYLSGTGADEVLSDYGFAGKKFFPHSSFGGLFPEALDQLFPWESWFLGTQRDYLMKEELVAGAHGVESRYPFLDRQVVQEYLWLTAETKNAHYKAPLHSWFEAVGYPFRKGEKLGFNADWNLREGGASLRVQGGLLGAPWVRGPSPEREAELAHAALVLESFEHSLKLAREEVAAALSKLEDRERHLQMDAELLAEEKVERIQAMLHAMVPRMAEMSLTAKPIPLTAKSELPAHDKWRSVEVVTCVSGGLQAVVADFPVYKIFRDTTPLLVTNVCEDIEWEGMHFRLHMYLQFFLDLPQTNPGELPSLFLVSDGLDVFFNDLVFEIDAPASEASWRTAEIIANRYEEISQGADGVRRPIVVSSERLCGWGGAKLCSDEDEARYPPSPTDSKYLNAGGYIGPAAAIASMLTAVLKDKEEATGEVKENGRESDQYFFKRYFWQHQHMIALDYQQSIFGNFLEVVNRRCETDWVPKCAVRPCCTESDNFRRFHDIFHGRYKVQGCAVSRNGRLPVSWHGNGAGKWLYLLALDGLALNCGAVANLTLARYPIAMLKGVFRRFEERASGEESWSGGFLLRNPTSTIEAPSQIPPAQCAEAEDSWR